MSWLSNQKDKITTQLRSRYTNTHHHILQLQKPLTNMERLENWIKLILWSILSLIMLLLISIEWTTLAGLYATAMVIIFWLKGWDPIAHRLAQHWQSISFGEAPQLVSMSRSAIAEQRLLKILTTATDWQALSIEDRNLKALHVLDAI